MDIFDIIKDKILMEIKDFVSTQLYGKICKNLTLDLSKDNSSSDLVTNLLQLMDDYQDSSKQIINIIQGLEEVKTCWVSGNDFVNIVLHQKVWKLLLEKISSTNDNFGKNITADKQNISLELFIPEKDFENNLLSYRASIVFEGLAEILKYSGYAVALQYNYIEKSLPYISVNKSGILTKIKIGPVNSMNPENEKLGKKELIEMVGSQLSRQIMLSARHDGLLYLDFKKMREISKDNPIFYLHYASVRCGHIKSELYEEFPEILNETLVRIESINDEDMKLIKHISKWSKIVKHCAESLDPYIIIIYLNRLSEIIHENWQNYKKNYNLIENSTQKNQYAKSKIATVECASIIARNGLKNFNVDIVDEM